MYFYKTNNNGIYTFTQAESNKGLEDWQETDRELVVLHDGTIAFADEVDIQKENNAIAEQKAHQLLLSLQPTDKERLDAIEEMLLALAEGE